MLLTPQAIQENQQYYANVDLAKENTTKLREIFRRCGGRQLETGRGILPASKARKDELLQSIDRLLEPTRLMATAIINAEVDYDINEFYHTPESLFAELREVMSLEKKTEQVEAITNIVWTLNNRIIAKHPGNSQFNSRNNLRNKFATQLRQLIKASDSAIMDAAFVYFKDALRDFSKRDNECRANEYRTNLSEKDVNSFDLDGLKQWAIVTCETSDYWADIALALGYLSGRRIGSEILTKATEYKVVDGVLWVRGLAKQKTEKLNIEWQQIPCIAIESFFIGLRKIECKRLSVNKIDDLVEVASVRNKANRNFESSLRKQSKALEKFGIVKVHNLRAAYAEYFTQHIEDKNERLKQAELVLGHQHRESAALAYIN